MSSVGEILLALLQRLGVLRRFYFLEILRDGENAVLVPPSDFEAAFQALSVLLKDEDRLNPIDSRAVLNGICSSRERRARDLLKFIEERLRAQPKEYPPPFS
jgi:glycosyltransferase involved in cell wall biosynthesis